MPSSGTTTILFYGGHENMVRLRQRDVYEALQSISGDAYYGGGKVASYSTTLETSTGSAQAVEDNYLGRIPIFKRRLKKEAVPPLNNVRMSKVSHAIPPGTWDYTSFVLPYTYALTGGPLSAAAMTHPALSMPLWRPPRLSTSLVFTQVSTNVSSYLYQRALSKASSAEFDFGVTVGEVAETAAFLAKPLGGIAKLSAMAFGGVRAIYVHGTTVCIQIAKNATAKEVRRLKATTKRHPIDTSLRILDESANHWLAYKFGVIPLLDDIAKVTEFKQENVQRLLGLRQSRVKGFKAESTQLQTFKDFAFGYFYYDVDVLVRSEDRHYFGLYWQDKINAPLANFMEQLGFAPWQLPSLAYELIPLSFVVDRFIDIKSFVRGNIGSLVKHQLGSYCTRKAWTKYVYQIKNIRFGSPSSPTMTLSRPMEPSSALYEQVCRSVNPDRPVFPVTNPYWREQLVADATNLSLIWGRLRSHVGKLI